MCRPHEVHNGSPNRTSSSNDSSDHQDTSGPTLNVTLDDVFPVIGPVMIGLGILSEI